MTAARVALAGPPSAAPRPVILLATDFCAPARSALACACQIARLRGASVRAVHVMDLTGASSADRPSYSIAHDSAASRLRDIRREMRRAGVAESATLVTAGSPARAIRQVAAKEQASLLILGVNGTRSRKPSTLGPTARALLGHAPCSVLTVAACDPKLHTETPRSLDRPLFVTDTASESLRAALAAWPALSRPQIRLVLSPRGQSRLQLDPDIRRRFAPARVLEFHGAALTLLRESAAIHAGLIVFSLRAGGYLDSFASGSFAHALITAAGCPVLTVRR